MEHHKARLFSRQATSIVAGTAIGGAGAGPSISLLAGMGDIYYSIERIALRNKLFVHTVDATRPILPQLPNEIRGRISNELVDITKPFLLGTQE